MCELLGEKPKRRRNENRLVNEMKDIVDMLTRCDDNNIKLPRFVADYFDGLPPTSGFEVIANYITQLNDELLNLRKEVGHLKECRSNNEICNPDVAFIKEDLMEIRGEIRKLNHKLLNDNIRRDSLILECIENSSKNAIVDENKENSIDVATSFSAYKDHAKSNLSNGKSKSVLHKSSSVESLPHMIEEKLLPSAPSISGEVLYFQREVQDFGGVPSAPSYADVAFAGVEDIPRNSNGTVAFTSKNRYQNEKENAIRNDNLRKNPRHSSETRPDEKIIDKQKSVQNDDDSYQLVKRKRRPANIVGSKRTKANETIRGAVRVADLYLGNCELDVTPESISDYIFKEMNIAVSKCEPLVTKNQNSL